MKFHGDDGLGDLALCGGLTSAVHDAFEYRTVLLPASTTPPWGTKGNVNRAGKKIRAREALSIDDLRAFESWRAAHSYVLNTFKPLLWSRVKGKDIIFAQRLKRRHTIIDKLFREPSMELARMDDIAGCRLIFSDVNRLNAFRDEFHNARFKHKRRHDDKEKYNYIKNPKESGYRGIHEIYAYNVSTLGGMRFNGLYVEMQFRTLCQHAWATAVEVVSRITENQPKFDRGDVRHREFFRLASEIIARSEEGLASCRPELTNAELARQFRELDSEINVLHFLKAVPVIEQNSRIKNNVVLQLSSDGKLIVHKFPSIETATEGYFDLEKKNPSDDIVLVRANTFAEIRSAYRNYFQNTNEFIRYIEVGLKFLEDEDDATRQR